MSASPSVSMPTGTCPAGIGDSLCGFRFTTVDDELLARRRRGGNAAQALPKKNGSSSPRLVRQLRWLRAVHLRGGLAARTEHGSQAIAFENPDQAIRGLRVPAARG